MALALEAHSSCAACVKRAGWVLLAAAQEELRNTEERVALMTQAAQDERASSASAIALLQMLCSHALFVGLCRRPPCAGIVNTVGAS